MDKRTRCSNFYPRETQMLLELVPKYSAAIECKITNVIANCEKERAWEKLCSEFNAACPTGRTTKMLRGKWNSLKKTSRQQYFKHKEIYKSDPPLHVFDSTIGRVLEITGKIARKGSGSENNFDLELTGDSQVEEGVPTQALNNEGPSTRAQSSNDEEMYLGDDDDDESDYEDRNNEMLDETDAQTLVNNGEELRVDATSENPTSKECDLFGEYLAKNLQQLPVDVALKLQSEIQVLVMQKRLECIRNHQPEAPTMVIEDVPEKETTEAPIDDPVENRSEKRSQNTEQPEAKRFKSDSSASKTTKSNPSTTQAQQKQIRKTECTVFAEYITLQLEQLPEETSLQLQTEIQALITQACSKHTVEEVSNRVKIKDEVVEVTPSEIIYA